MMSLPQSALVIRLTSQPCTVLPDLHPHFTVLHSHPLPPKSPSQSTSSHPPPPLNTTPKSPSHTPKQSPIHWLRQGRSDLPSINGPLELSTAIRSFRPARVYVVLPCIPVEQLPAHLIHPLLQAEQALRHARISPPSFPIHSTPSSSSHQPHHAVRITANPPYKVTLLFDGSFSQSNINRYDALFQPHEVLCGYAAASVLLSRMNDIKHTSSSTRWSGPIFVPHDMNNDSGSMNQQSIEFSGFHLVVNNPKFAKSLHLSNLRKARYAHIRAFAPKMPEIGSCQTATPGLELRLAQTSSPRTTEFFNQLAALNKGFLLSIGDTNFWCFWGRNTNSHSNEMICHAFCLGPLSRVSVPAFDTPARIQSDYIAHREKENIPTSGNSSPESSENNSRRRNVRKLPPTLLSLPALPFLCNGCDSSETAAEKKRSPSSLFGPPRSMAKVLESSFSVEDYIANVLPHPQIGNCVKRPNTDISGDGIPVLCTQNGICTPHGLKQEEGEANGSKSTNPSSTLSLEEQLKAISAPELRELRNRRDKESINVLTNRLSTPSSLHRQMTNTNSLTSGRRSSQQGSANGSKLDVQMAFRKRRFDRYMQSNSDKATTTAMGASQSRLKRGRTSLDITTSTRTKTMPYNTGAAAVRPSSFVQSASSRRFSSTQSGARPQQRQSNQDAPTIFLNESMRACLQKSEEASALYKPAPGADTDAVRLSSSELATYLRDDWVEDEDDYNRSGENPGTDRASRFTKEWISKAKAQQGCHGVEYLFEGEEDESRDKRIVEFETITSRMKIEFLGSSKSNAVNHPVNGMKIKNAVASLCNGPSMQLPPSQDSQHSASSNQETNTRNTHGTSYPPSEEDMKAMAAQLKKIFEGIQCGKVNVSDSSLKDEFLQSRGLQIAINVNNQ